MEEYVLYIASDKKNPDTYCKGSVMCMKMLDALPSKLFNVQNCDMLRQKNVQFPNWLTGTPVIVDKENGEIYKGSLCTQFLRELLQEEVRNQKLNSKNTISPKIENEHTDKTDYINRDKEQYVGFDENVEEVEDNYDPWETNDESISNHARDLDSQPKSNQEDVEAFMKQRQRSISQIDIEGKAPPSIPQEPS